MQGDWQVRPVSQDQNQHIQFVAGATGHWPLGVPALLDHLTMLLHHCSKCQQVNQKTIKSWHADDDCR